MSLTMKPRSATSPDFGFNLLQEGRATLAQSSSAVIRRARVTSGPPSPGSRRRRKAVRPDGSVIQERRQDDRVLFQIVDDDSLGSIHVRVVLANVVVVIVLHGVESNHSRPDEAQMVRAANAQPDIATEPEILERLHPR